MDTFLVTLVLVLILIAILVAVSAYFPYYPEGVPKDIRVVHEFSPGVIGYSENYVSRTQNFGSFGVGLPQKEELKSVAMMEITAGLFGSNSEKFEIPVPQHVIDWLKEGEITFRVDDTNKYGNLIIKWNGADLYNAKSDSGPHSVEIKRSQIKQDNTLEISAQGPGMIFWAATVYKLKDFRVNVEYGPAKFVDFEVSSDELESLDKFELLWYTTSRRGNLVVKVNGEEIYNAVPDRQAGVEFTDTSPRPILIKPGTNRLTFMAVNGSFNLDDVLMNTYVSKNQMVVKERFELKEPQVNSLKAKGGVVKIYVEDVENPGELIVKLNGENIGSVQAKDGWNRVTFDGEVCETGSNWLEISGTGTFDVGEVSVEVA